MKYIKIITIGGKRHDTVHDDCTVIFLTWRHIWAIFIKENHRLALYIKAEILRFLH